MSDASKTLPLVTIVTIVLNGEKSLQRAIDSIVGQSYPNIEYIIVDGGSTDGTLEIIRRNETSISKWISEPDKGISDAFNKGVGLANGSVVGFVNSDDWYERNAVEEIAPHFKEFDVVYGEVQFWDGDRTKNRTNASHKKLMLGMTIAHPAVFVRKSMFEKFGLFDLNVRIAMDYDWIARLFFAKATFHKIEKVLVNMTLGGLSDRYWFKAFIEEYSVKRRYMSRIKADVFFIKQVLSFFLKVKIRRIFD